MDIPMSDAPLPMPLDGGEKTSASATQKPIKIFFCYAREDELQLRMLQKQLGALKRQGIVDTWHDRDINAGTEWQQAIDQQLNSAQIVLLLVSPDFINSDYCYSIEMMQAVERHRRGETHVIPVILRPVYWQKAPFSNLQALPEDARPISRWPNVDDAFFDVAEGIRKIVEVLNKEATVIASPSANRRVPSKNEQQNGPASFFKFRVGRRSIFKTVVVSLFLALLIGTNIAWFSVLQQDQLGAAVATTAAANGYWDATAQEVQFGFDASHTHWNRYERLINTTNINRLTLLWSYETNDGIGAAPVIANGIVYAGSFDGNLYAFDAACQSACHPLWHYEAGKSIVSSPAVARGLVYVGSDDGNFYAFDATCRSACQPLWYYRTGARVRSSPTIANGIVYVGSDNGRIYAFDANCRTACSILWFYQTVQPIVSSPAVANGIVYVSSFDGKLYAFDATCRHTCKPLWAYQTGQPIVSSPAIANGIVYVGSENHKFYAFDATCRNDCQPIWFYQGEREFGASPAVANKMVYTGSDDGKLYAFDATCRSACQPVWSYQTGNVVYSSPMVANGIVYVGSRDGNLYAFDTACRHTCQPIWSYQTGSAIVASITIVNGTIYIGSYDHSLSALGFSV